MKTYTTEAIAKALGGELVGDGSLVIERVAHPSDVRGDRDLALAMDAKLVPLLTEKPPRAAVINKGANLEPGIIAACIIVDRPRLALAKLTNLFADPVGVPNGVHPTAIVEAGASIGANAAIGAYSYICKGAIIGDNCVIHPQTYIGPDAKIGKDALIYPGVRIGHGVQIGARIIIHFNTSIGADGFSFVTPQNGQRRSR